MRIFSLWRGSGPFGLPFLLRASIPQKNRSLSHPPRCESIKVGESANSTRQLYSFQKPDVVVQVGGLGIPVSGSRVRKRMGTITKLVCLSFFLFLCFYYRPYFIECQSLFQTFCVKKCYIIDKQFVIWYSEIS